MGMWPSLKTHQSKLSPPHLPLASRTVQLVCPAGAITTLGRGGSDLTATLIGAALHVPEVQVWKDVDGARQSMPPLPVG